MSIKKGKYPIICTIIEGFGLSSSWQGNAILAAKPTGFYSLWQQNPHTVLYPNITAPDLSYENEEIDFSRMMTGSPLFSNKKYIDEQIKSFQIQKNSALLKIFDDAQERNSALHLVGNLSFKNGAYGDINHLFEYLRLAKRRKIFRVYVHLFLDNDILRSPEIIDLFLKNFHDIGLGEIATVCGQKYLSTGQDSQKNFLTVLSSIIFGRGKRALGEGQALSLAESNSPSEKVPTSVLFKGNYVCRMNDFDVVLFFNHNNESLSRLMLTLSREGTTFKRFNLPRFLTIASPFLPFEQPVENIFEIFRRKFVNSLLSDCEKSGKNQLFISDSSRISFIRNFYPSASKNIFIPIIQNNNPKNYNQVYEIILSQLSYVIENKTADIIYILIPALSYAYNINNFAILVDSVKMMDKFLSSVARIIFGTSGTLVISSDHGKIEKITGRNDYEELNNKTVNPVPFIVAINDKNGLSDGKDGISFDRLIYDMIKKKHFMNDFAPTLLDLVGIPKPDYMNGRNISEELNI